MATTERRGIEFPDQEFRLPAGFRTQIHVGHPAWDQRHPNPRQDYGIGCVELVFDLIGPRGAISFEVFTGWYLPHTAERLRRQTQHQAFEHSGNMMRCSLEGHPGRTSFHQPTPMYDDQHASGTCQLLNVPCYSDVGFTIGEELWTALVSGGEPGLWKAMKELHDGLGRD